MAMLPCQHSRAFSSESELTKFNFEFASGRAIANLPKNLDLLSKKVPSISNLEGMTHKDRDNRNIQMTHHCLKFKIQLKIYENTISHCLI